MKIYNEKVPVLVTPSKMNDGEIGIIRKWAYDVSVGVIVKRVGNNLISLAICHGSGGVYENAVSQLNDQERSGIEILPAGTLIEL